MAPETKKWRTRRECLLRTIVLSGARGYDHGKVSKDDIRALTPDEFESVQRAVQKIVVSSPNDPIPSGGLDGSMWFLTVNSFPNKSMSVWTPGGSPPLERHADTL
jgi:hypothetical protein